VVVTLWQDEFKRADGKMIYVREGDIANPDTRPDHRELIDNLEWARDHLEGRVSVIVTIAKDKTAHPRTIAECHPSKMRARVTHVDRASGSFRFEAELA